MYQFTTHPLTPPTRGGGKTLPPPLSPSLRGIKGEGGGQVGVLNCYLFIMDADEHRLRRDGSTGSPWTAPGSP